MSRPEYSGTPVRECVLYIPEVEPGDVGLVVELLGFQHDIADGAWWILCAGGRLYRLPPELNDWASLLDADVKRRFVSLPRVVAFSSVDGEYQVRLLSNA